MGIQVDTPEVLDIPKTPETEMIAEQPSAEIPETTVENPTEPEPVSTVSAFSLAGLRARKELEQQKREKKADPHAAVVEAFSEDDLLLQWNKYASRLSAKGEKIMESLMLMQNPKLDGFTVIHELPNDSSRIDFENHLHDLTGYLRGKLHNHELSLRLVVNEAIDNRMAFTPQDRYNRLNQLNPALEQLRKTFDLDF